MLLLQVYEGGPGLFAEAAHARAGALSLWYPPRKRRSPKIFRARNYHVT